MKPISISNLTGQIPFAFCLLPFATLGTKIQRYIRMDTSLISIACILGIPLLGNMGLSLEPVTHSLVRLLLLLYILYSISVSEVAGLLAVLAVVTIIGERNFRSLIGFPLQRGTIPYKHDVLIENVDAVEYSTMPSAQEELEYKDSNPRLAAAPTGAKSAKFFMDKKLSL